MQVDSQNNIFVAGATASDLNGETNSGGLDVALPSFSSSGSHQWTILIGTTEDDDARALQLDADGHLVVAGHTRGSLNGANAGLRDVFVMSFTSTGANRWIFQRGTVWDDYAMALQVDLLGNIVLAGFTGEARKRDILLISLTSSGSHKWTVQHGSTSSTQAAYALVVDHSNNLVVLGESDGDLDGQTNSWNTDICLVSFNNTGSHLWTALRGGDYNEIGWGLQLTGWRRQSRRRWVYQRRHRRPNERWRRRRFSYEFHKQRRSPVDSTAWQHSPGVRICFAFL